MTLRNLALNSQRNPVCWASDAAKLLGYNAANVPVGYPLALPYVVCWSAYFFRDNRDPQNRDDVNAWIIERRRAQRGPHYNSIFLTHAQPTLAVGVDTLLDAVNRLPAEAYSSAQETLDWLVAYWVANREPGGYLTSARLRAAMTFLALIRADSRLTPSVIEQQLRTVYDFYSGKPPPAADDCWWSGRLRPTAQARTMPYRDRSLMHTLEAAPLGADLHRHLTGTGSAEFWHSHAERLGEHLTYADFLLQGRGWGAFNKAYEARNVIKEDPSLVEDLLRLNIQEAVEDRVCYLELSAGAALFLDDTLWSICRRAAREGEKSGVVVRFLVGLRRDFVYRGLPVRPVWDGDRYRLGSNPLNDFVTMGEHHMLAQEAPAYFETNRDIDSLIRKGVFQDPLCVGVDFCGWERAESIRGQFPASLGLFSQVEESEGLGVRIHAGENIEHLTELHEVIQYADVLKPRGVRIGHGLGLQAAIEYEEFGSWRGVREDADRVLGDGEVPIEVNLTSNEALAGVRLQDHPLPLFLSAGWTCVLSTDNPGIHRTTLRNEFRRAVATGLLKSRSELRDAIVASIWRSFLPRTDRESLLERVEHGL